MHFTSIKILFFVFAKAVAASGIIFFTMYFTAVLGVLLTGKFLFLLSISIGFSIYLKAGLENLIIKRMAIYESESDWAGYSLIWKYAHELLLRRALNLMLFFIILSLASWWFGATWWWQILVIFIIAIAISLMGLLSSRMKANSQPAYSVFEEVNGVLLMCIPIYLLISDLIIGGHYSHIALPLTFLLTCLVVYVIGLLLASGILMPSVKGLKVELEAERLDFYLISISTFLMHWGVLVVVGFILDEQSVAIYNAAHRTAFLVNFILLLVNIILAPKLAVLHSRGQYRDLFVIMRRSVIFMSLVAFPVCLILIVFSSNIMAIYGSVFDSGSIVLCILSFAQLINVVTGPVGFFLNMSGHQRVMRNLVLTVSVITLLSLIFLGSAFGMLGIATAIAAGIIVQNIAAARIGWRVLRANI
jgi:O-antigen/teichoic acid export membrane protein